MYDAIKESSSPYQKLAMVMIWNQDQHGGDFEENAEDWMSNIVHDCVALVDGKYDDIWDVQEVWDCLGQYPNRCKIMEYYYQLAGKIWRKEI